MNIILNLILYPYEYDIVFDIVSTRIWGVLCYYYHLSEVTPSSLCKENKISIIIIILIV